MPCVKATSGSAAPSGFRVYATEAECTQACREGACCEGTTCSIKPQCQCQGAGQTFKGVGTTCTPNPCVCYCQGATESVMPDNLLLTISGYSAAYPFVDNSPYAGVNGVYVLSPVAGSCGVYSLNVRFGAACTQSPSWIFAAFPGVSIVVAPGFLYIRFIGHLVATGAQAGHCAGWELFRFGGIDVCAATFPYAGSGGTFSGNHTVIQPAFSWSVDTE